MASISACLIVKNEDRCIVRCLSSLISAVNEIIVVDTGSTDKTIEIVKKISKKNKKVRIYNFKWCDDFSAARNFAISKAKSKWILSIDADEYLHPEDTKKLSDVIKITEQKVDFPVFFDLQILNVINGEITSIHQKGICRLFKKHEQIYYEGIIHENITGSLERLEMYNYLPLDIRLVHDGYDQKVVNQEMKSVRNINLLNKALEKEPNDPVYLAYLAKQTGDIDLFKKSLIMVENSEKEFNYILEIGKGTFSFIPNG